MGKTGLYQIKNILLLSKKYFIIELFPGREKARPEVKN